MDEYSSKDVLQAISEAVMVVDTNGFVEFINPSCEEMFGYGNQESQLQCVDQFIPNFIRNHIKLLYFLHNRCGNIDFHSFANCTGMSKGGELLPLAIGVGKLEKGNHRALLLTIRDASRSGRVEKVGANACG